MFGQEQLIGGIGSMVYALVSPKRSAQGWEQYVQMKKVSTFSCFRQIIRLLSG